MDDLRSVRRFEVYPSVLCPLRYRTLGEGHRPTLSHSPFTFLYPFSGSRNPLFDAPPPFPVLSVAAYTALSQVRLEFLPHGRDTWKPTPWRMWTLRTPPLVPLPSCPMENSWIYSRILTHLLTRSYIHYNPVALVVSSMLAPSFHMKSP
jgi:hypothetical protein